MNRLYSTFLLFTLVLSDIVLINISLFLGYHVANKYMVDVDHSLYTQSIVSCTIIWLLSSAVSRLYTFETIQNVKNMYKSTLISMALLGLTFSGYVLYTNQATFPVEFLATFFPLVLMSFVLSRLTATAIEEQLAKYINNTSENEDRVSVSRVEA